MIKVGMMVELLEEYSLIMVRLSEQIFLPRRFNVQFLNSLRSSSTDDAQSSPFFVYF